MADLLGRAGERTLRTALRQWRVRSSCAALALASVLGLSHLGCLPFGTDDGVTGPGNSSDFSVTAEADTLEPFEGATLHLTASVSGGAPPYIYRWDLNAGPAELDLSQATEAEVTTEPLAVPGRYVFRITATDSLGARATDFLSVDVVSIVDAEVPGLVVVGEPVEITATLLADDSDATVLWEITKGSATIADETAGQTTLTTELGETLDLVLTVSAPTEDEGVRTLTRTFEIVSVFDLRPRVLVSTNLGDFTIELDGEAAPLHTANFLAYADDGFFDGLLFHRVVCVEDAETETCPPFIVQAGGYERIGDELEAREPTREVVPSETDNGLTNGELYSVALGDVDVESESPTTRFFINLNEDNGSMDADFTVFGLVVAGTDVVDAIAAVETIDNPVTPFDEVSLPVDDIVIERLARGLSVSVTPSGFEVFEGQSVLPTANALGGTPPFAYHWEQDGGPETLDLAEVDAAALSTGPLTTVGTYTFSVTATDAAGLEATASISIEVQSVVEVTPLTLGVVGEAVDLLAELDSALAGMEVQWEIVRGSGVIADAGAAATTIVPAAPETIEVRLTVTLPFGGQDPVTTTRSVEIVAVTDLHPRVLVETTLGDFTLELDGEAAPRHTANLLAYVDDGFYDGLLFHRAACVTLPDAETCDPFVIQGGGVERIDGELELKEPTREPVVSEADNGLSNGVLYSVSLALTASGPDSGTTQFFVNLSEENATLNGQSFTVFAMVVEGTDVVDAILNVDTVENPFAPPGEVSLPAEDVVIERMSRVEP